MALVSWRGEPVADGGVALQELPVLVAELAPDAVGVDLQVVVFAAVTGTPDVLQDHPAGADLSRVPSEVGKEVEFFGREVEGTAVEGGLAVDEVEMQGPGVEVGRAIFVTVPDPVVAERDLHPGVELAHAEWLGHVVIGAVLKRVDLAVFGTVCGQHDDRNVAPGSDALADVQAVQVGQAQVEHDDIRCVDRCMGEALVPGLGGPDAVTEGFQPDGTDAEQAWIVVNDENLRQPSAPRVSALLPAA